MDKDKVKITKEIEDYYSSHDIENVVSHAECRGTFASNAQGRIYSFKEFKDYFENKKTLEECILNLKQNSRRYAKRQITWFKKDKEIYWFFLDLKSSYKIKKEILNLLQNFFS